MTPSPNGCTTLNSLSVTGQWGFDRGPPKSVTLRYPIVLIYYLPQLSHLLKRQVEITIHGKKHEVAYV